MPVCKNVTKQQCNTMWVVNEVNEKVLSGNEDNKEVARRIALCKTGRSHKRLRSGCAFRPLSQSPTRFPLCNVDVTTYIIVFEARANFLCN